MVMRHSRTPISSSSQLEADDFAEALAASTFALATIGRRASNMHSGYMQFQLEDV